MIFWLDLLKFENFSRICCKRYTLNKKALNFKIETILEIHNAMFASENQDF